MKKFAIRGACVVSVCAVAVYAVAAREDGWHETQLQDGRTDQPLGTQEEIKAASKRALEEEQNRLAVRKVLDGLHAAAAKADGKMYFKLFTDDAVFIGTDATERWTIAEFKDYAMKRFETGKGWTYTLTPDSRHVQFSKAGDVAWFDEMLENAKYGTCRGTGVLVLTDSGWRIAQYHLTIPVPNELAEEVVGKIRAISQ